MRKRIDVSGISPVIGTLCPPPFDLSCRTRERKKLGDAAGLTQFGVNPLRLPPSPQQPIFERRGPRSAHWRKSRPDSL